MTATVMAVIPLSGELVEALGRARLSTAGRLACYFEGAAVAPEAFEVRLRRAWVSRVLEAQMLSVWLDELLDYLPDAEDHDLRRAARVSSVPVETKVAEVLRRAAANVPERPTIGKF